MKHPSRAGLQYKTAKKSSLSVTGLWNRGSLKILNGIKLQMLGCGAHVRKIALPHVRCACGSACGKAFGTVRAMCVRAAGFLECDVRSHFCTLF